MKLSNGPTVLIVDDDPQVRVVYSTYLEDGYEIRTAGSGQAALTEMDDDVDVVLLDRRMDGLSGGDVLSRFRDLGYDQPIVLVTGVNPDFDILEMGFDDYVVKPVGADELKDVVQTMLLRKEYDEVMRQYFSLVSKVAALQMEKTPDELRADESYLQSQRQLDTIKVQARTALNVAIDEGKFDALFQELNSPAHESDADDSVGEAKVISSIGDD